MARPTSKQANVKGKGKKPSYDAPSSDSDPSRIAVDVNKALDKSRKLKNKKPPAPTRRDGADSSESESESSPSDNELALLRAENAKLRAEFENRSKKAAIDPVPTSSGPGPTPASTKRIPPPDAKTKINATKWRKMLGWEENKGPWLQCRAYTRRAISRAPLDLMRPWKQQDPADLSSAIALLVKRVPQLEQFEKNWGALQLIQETFNHMRATFLANELSSGSENDNYIRKKRKKELALKNNQTEEQGGKEKEQSNGDEQKTNSGEESSSDKEEFSDEGGDKASAEGKALENTKGWERSTPVASASGLLHSPTRTREPTPCSPRSPRSGGIRAHEQVLPDGTRTLESLWTRVSSKAKSGPLPKPVRHDGGRQPEPSRPDGPSNPKSPGAEESPDDYAARPPTPSSNRDLQPPIDDPQPGHAPSEGHPRLPSPVELPPPSGSADPALPDVTARSTTAAAALAAINNGVPVPDKSKARATKKRAPASVSKDTTSPTHPTPTAATPRTRSTRGEDQGEPVPSKPKSPRLPAREQLPRKSKTQRKSPPATPAPKGKKRKAEQDDEEDGKKRAKKGASTPAKKARKTG